MKDLENMAGNILNLKCECMEKYAENSAPGSVAHTVNKLIHNRKMILLEYDHFGACP
jgi:hypothetical protein